MEQRPTEATLRSCSSFSLTTHLKTVADYFQPFMSEIFPDGSGFFKQNNALCHTSKSVQESGKHLWVESPPHHLQSLEDLQLLFWLLSFRNLYNTVRSVLSLLLKHFKSSITEAAWVLVCIQLFALMMDLSPTFWRKGHKTSTQL